MINHRLGFMQGRLVNSEKKRIQYFPSKNWVKELQLANLINFKIMEWTIDKDNLQKNPLFNDKVHSVKEKTKKYQIKISSVTLDYFMQEPFFRKKGNKRKNIQNLFF